MPMATSYLPLDIAAGTALASTDPGPGGTYSQLADLGHAPATYTETARVRPPDDDKTLFLHMDPDQRVVAIRRRVAVQGPEVLTEHPDGCVDALLDGHRRHDHHELREPVELVELIDGEVIGERVALG